MSAVKSPKPGWRWSLGARLTAWYTVSSFLVVLLAMGLVYSALAHNLDREDSEALATKIDDVKMAMTRLDAGLALRQEVMWEAPIAEPRVYIRILTPDGRLVMETPGMSRLIPRQSFPVVAQAQAVGKGTKLHGPLDRSYLAATVEEPYSGNLDIVQVALDRSPENKLLAQYRDLLLRALLAAVGFCGLLGYWIARLGMRPVQEIARTAMRIGSENLDERIAPAPLPAEIADLAGAFNSMLDRLEAAFKRLTQFSADLAHELRTPLNNLRGEAEVALSKARTVSEYQEVLGSGLEEYGRLSQVIDSLLFLARAEDPGAQITRDTIAVGPELEAIKGYYEAAASERDVALAVRSADGILTRVDRTLIQRAIGNLVSNAIRHTPAGGSVLLSATQANGAVTIAVADTGRGIPVEHLPHIFERFYRVAPARTGGEGGGLGLALVRTISTLHGGTVTAESTVGQGTTITLTLPVG